MRLTYLTLGLPPTSEPETFKPYCQYGAEGERVGSFRWEYLVQSEEKAASLRWGGARDEVTPLVGVGRGQQVDTRQWRALLACVPIRGVALSF